MVYGNKCLKMFILSTKVYINKKKLRGREEFFE
jgi:hypothetical protein